MIGDSQTCSCNEGVLQFDGRESLRLCATNKLPMSENVHSLAVLVAPLGHLNCYAKCSYMRYLHYGVKRFDEFLQDQQIEIIQRCRAMRWHSITYLFNYSVNSKTRGKVHISFYAMPFVQKIFQSDKYLSSYTHVHSYAHTSSCECVRYFYTIFAKTGMCWSISVNLLTIKFHENWFSNSWAAACELTNTTKANRCIIQLFVAML
jgi:hypothetical protein